MYVQTKKFKSKSNFYKSISKRNNEYSKFTSVYSKLNERNYVCGSSKSSLYAYTAVNYSNISQLHFPQDFKLLFPCFMVLKLCIYIFRNIHKDLFFGNFESKV